jgi:hypothetical protein
MDLQIDIQGMVMDDQVLPWLLLGIMGALPGTAIVLMLLHRLHNYLSMHLGDKSRQSNKESKNRDGERGYQDKDGYK